MKKAILFLATIICVFNSVKAQSITQITHRGKPAIAISCNSETEDFDNIQLFLDKKGLEKFSKKLIKKLRKFGIWSNAASDNSIVNFEKNLRKGLDFQGLYFEHDSCSYTFFNCSAEPKFIVDESGNPYLKFEEECKGTIGTDIVAVSQGFVSGYNSFSVLSSATQIRKLVKFKFRMQIPKSDIPNWLNELNMAKIRLEEAEEEQKMSEKRNRKLFK